MDPLSAASGIIGAIGDGISGFLGQKQADSSNRQQLAIAQANMNMQREFAQNGIKWKVDDAMRSGVHPLFALGANTNSFSPVSIGSTQSDTSWASRAGQNLGRAIQATSTEGERERQMASSLQLERGQLENELIRTQISRLKGQIGPPMPSMGFAGGGLDGQGNAPVASAASGIRLEPSSVVASQADAPGQESGINPEYAYFRTPTGWALGQSKNFKQSSEDDFASEMAFNFRNRVFPPPPPSNVRLPDGYKWRWSPFRQQWEQERSSFGRNPAPNEGYGM